MNECSFERLLQLLEKKLGTDAQLRLFDHLDRCEICRETIYHIARDRDETLEVLLPRGNSRGLRTQRQVKRSEPVVARFSRVHRSASRPPATGTLG